jgi:NADPH-dependent 2,4-dienoyl-CoA reductase/sulfur reductase-like enzyme
MTAAAAARGIREVDATGSIAILAEERARPYARPPLSKALWLGKKEDSIHLQLPSGVEMLSGRKVTAIDRAHHHVRDDRGQSYGYQKLLLATGGTPRRLPFADERVIYFRTLEDYRALRSVKGERVTVVGGGFIGSEIAAALSQNGKKVTMAFPDSGICARAWPADLSQFVTGYFREKGVEVLSGQAVTGIDGAGVHLDGGRILEAEAIVAGIGIAPNVEMAEHAGIKTDDGIEVDEGLRTSDPDIFAAGDVARFFSLALGRRVRVEHEDNAVTMGVFAGRAMAGQKVRYEHLPFFYSDLFDLGYEAVGDLDSRLETLSVWKTPFREGIVYYLGEGRVRGVLLWNTWNQVEHARVLVADPGPFTAKDIAGRLPIA